MPNLTLQQKLHPARFSDMSPQMAAIVGCIIGIPCIDPSLTSMHITSDGFVLATAEGDIGANDFIGSADDLDRNWENLLVAAGLSEDEVVAANDLRANVTTDWRDIGIPPTRAII